MLSHINVLYENVFYEELKRIIDLIINHHPNCKKVCISCPIARTDNKKTNNVLKAIYQYIKKIRKEFYFS